MLRLRLASFVLFAAFAAPAVAQPALSEDEAAQAMDFAMHDAVFTLYHEAGHLLVHELGLPVLGKEEDAADALAIVQIFKSTTDGDELFNTLNDVADGWYFSSLNMTGEDVDTYDDHSLDIQRANATVCMMVGANPDEFTETADNYGLTPDQQEGCAGTYTQAVDSWTAVLSTHLATAPGPEIPVTYEDPGPYAALADELKSRRILENLAEYLRTHFALPDGITFVATQCDEANAFYAEDTHSITYCYELADDMYKLGAANLFTDDPQGRPQ